MSRPKKKISIEKQLQAVIAQAVEEGRHDLAKAMIDLLKKGEEKKNASDNLQE